MSIMCNSCGVRFHLSHDCFNDVLAACDRTLNSLPYRSYPIADAKNYCDLFEHFGFDEIERNNDGDIVDLFYSYGNWNSDIDHFLETIAPYVQSHSFITFVFDDGTYSRYYFDGESVMEYSGEIVFPGCPAYQL